MRMTGFASCHRAHGLRPTMPLGTSVTEALADEHERDPARDALLLDDQHLAALPFRRIALVVSTDPVRGARRLAAQRSTFLGRRPVAKTTEGGGERRRDLVDAGHQVHLAAAVGVAGDPAAAAVHVQDLPGEADGVDATHEVLGGGRPAAQTDALPVVVQRLDPWTVVLVVPRAQDLLEPDRRQRRR